MAVSGGTANDGFFSRITASVQSGVSNLASAASTLLPVWSQFTKDKQSKDNLANPTVDQSKLGKSLNGFGGLASSPLTLALVVGAVILGVVLIVKARR